MKLFLCLPRTTYDGRPALFCDFSFKEVDDGGSDHFSDLVCQGIYRTVFGIAFVRVEAVVQGSVYVCEAQAFVFEPFDFFDDEEVLEGVAALAAFGAEGDDDAVQFPFPEAKGVFGDTGALAHFLDGQCFD